MKLVLYISVLLSCSTSFTHSSRISCKKEKLDVLVLASRSSSLQTILFSQIPNVVDSLQLLGESDFTGPRVGFATFGSNPSYSLEQSLTSSLIDYDYVRVYGDDDEGTSIADAMDAMAYSIWDSRTGWDFSGDTKKVILLFMPSLGYSTSLESISSNRVWASLKDKGFFIYLVQSISDSQDLFDDWIWEIHSQNIPYSHAHLDYSLPYLDFSKLAPGLPRGRCEKVVPFRHTRAADVGGCGIPPDIDVKIQVNMLFDRTSSFNKFFGLFSSLSEKLVTEFKTSNPGSEFALSSFCDFKLTQYRLGDDTTVTNEQNSCYELKQKFTTDSEKFAQAVKNVKPCSGGDLLAESILNAILFAATDKTVGWKNLKDGFDDDLKYVQKLLIFVTDAISHNESLSFIDEDKRGFPKGDGTDTCTNAWVPGYRFVGDKLRENKVKLIGFSEPSYAGTWWDPVMHLPLYMGLKKPSLYPMDLNNLTALAEDIKKAIRESIACNLDEGDPPAYNTLGL